ncbi:proton-conducting transporter membrane subunit, partial [Serratia marcescens]|uniref:proton-conducting transporter transmembrane domain-containing protein n=1 Tax=Serratia marcescens TaxID=615 RepID=UPI0013D8E519
VLASSIALAMGSGKRLLAYSTIGHTGVITVLLGLRGLLPVDTALLSVLYVFYPLPDKDTARVSD